jgi:hypothetical protein
MVWKSRSLWEFFVVVDSSKVAGGYVYATNDRKDGMRCIAIKKTVRSPAVQEYLTSDRWYATNYGDYLLYSAVNRSLDLTIERLGKKRFEEALIVFRNAQKLVGEHCDETAVFPCSANGTEQLELSKQSCYHQDEGCGFPCIDKLSIQHGW